MQRVLRKIRRERFTPHTIAVVRRKKTSLVGALGMALWFAVSAGAMLWRPGNAAAPPQQSHARIDCSDVPSRILQREVPYCVVLPPTYDADGVHRYPVLYDLHGLGDDEKMLLRPGVLNLVEGLWARKQVGEFLIVTPDGGASFYINSYDGQRYEDFLMREFLPVIERRYRILPGRESRALAGISMGGYGALHLAFAHPDVFGAVSAESPAIMTSLQPTGARTQLAALRGLGDVFGNPVDQTLWSRDNPLTLARTADLSHLKIYFDCGAKDDYGFEAGAQALHDELASRGIPHEFHLYPGGHDWNYFAAHLAQSLEFNSRAFFARAPTD
jgi:S-formylglutathione hydrolase FrmB